MSEITVEGTCHICQAVGQIWYIAIFWRGSEGLSVCHDCRMAITEAVRRMADVSNRRCKADFKRRRKVGTGED